MIPLAVPQRRSGGWACALHTLIVGERRGGGAAEAIFLQEENFGVFTPLCFCRIPPVHLKPKGTVLPLKMG